MYICMYVYIYKNIKNINIYIYNSDNEKVSTNMVLFVFHNQAKISGRGGGHTVALKERKRTAAERTGNNLRGFA